MDLHTGSSLELNLNCVSSVVVFLFCLCVYVCFVIYAIQMLVFDLCLEIYVLKSYLLCAPSSKAVLGRQAVQRSHTDIRPQNGKRGKFSSD